MIKYQNMNVSAAATRSNKGGYGANTKNEPLLLKDTYRGNTALQTLTTRPNTETYCK